MDNLPGRLMLAGISLLLPVIPLMSAGITVTQEQQSHRLLNPVHVIIPVLFPILIPVLNIVLISVLIIVLLPILFPVCIPVMIHDRLCRLSGSHPRYVPSLDSRPWIPPD